MQFSTGSETVNETAGTFSIPVTLSGTPTHRPSPPSPPGSTTPWPGLRRRRQPLRRQRRRQHGEQGDARGGGQHLRLRVRRPRGLAFDAAGNLYVANAGANTVSKVTPAGAVSTFASGFNDPDGLAFDAAGNLYVANSGNNTVSKVTPAGVVSTFASGFNDPDGLAFDAAGNLYVANAGNNTVSEVTPAGVVSTFASGFNVPVGLAFDAGRQPLRRQLQRQHGERGDARGGGQHLRLRVQRSRRPGLRRAGNLYVANDGNNTVSEVSDNRDRAVHAGRHRGLGHRLQRRHGQSAGVRDRADHRSTSPARCSPTPAPARR